MKALSYSFLNMVTVWSAGCGGIRVCLRVLRLAVVHVYAPRCPSLYALVGCPGLARSTLV